MKAFLATLASGARLSVDEAEELFAIVMAGEATPAQIGAILMALRVRGETVEEITGAVRVMRARVLSITAPAGAIDLVGTGGDGGGTFNISTGAALVVAGCGVPVAKHGNRAVSSKCGAADVLAALGVNLDADLSLIEQAIREAGIGFLMAPRHHAAMRHVAGPRGELGVRTILNLLGPLSNPAHVTRQFTGAFARAWIEPMARVLANLGCERAWVVHGSDGLDELTTTGPSFVAELAGGAVRTFTVSPADAGLPFAWAEDLKGGDALTNAAAMRAMLDGAPSPFRDAVVFNAGAALLVAGKVADLTSGVGCAAAAIASGRARAALDRLIAITNLQPSVAVESG
ncbi:MAG: anthranilate phosphoribosyltransferase [Rhodospirillales bacterium]|nr:anthranilate phosphoribosyltransferase [Rhodospirillales bacterium]